MKEADEPGPRRKAVPIATFFTLSLAIASLLTVGIMLAAGVFVGRDNLFRQLGSRFDLTIKAATDRVADHLTPAQHELQSLSMRIVRRPALIGSDEQLADMLGVAMAASPQIVATGFVRPDQTSVRRDRADDQSHINDLRERAGLTAVLAEARRRGPNARSLGWSDPLYGPNAQLPVIVYREPVWREQEFLGMLFAVVSLIDLSRFMEELSSDLGETLFILFDKKYVLAHPRLPGLGFAFSNEIPLPTLQQMGDATLAHVMQQSARSNVLQGHLKRAVVHAFDHEGVRWVHVFSEIRDYGSKPWQIGFHVSIRDTDEAARLRWMTGMGLAMLALSVLLALPLGRRLARPIRRIAEATSAVRDLDFAGVKLLPRSSIREIDDAARSINTMVRGLKLFETYVPRRLVRRLMEQEGSAGDVTRQRELTVMFTDLVGFSTLAERLSARETADLLNEHFQLIVACTRESDGTIDKYLGDGAMAFWGAPKWQEDHARRACEAALAIAAAVKADNDARLRRGAPSLRVRIALHSGPVIVGNIGAKDRINYTIVGDTVNVAARLLEVGRERKPENALVLASSETLAAAGGEFKGELLGRRTVKGRQGEVGIHLLAAL